MALDLAYYKGLKVAYTLDQLYNWTPRSDVVRLYGTPQIWTFQGGGQDGDGQFGHRYDIPADIYSQMLDGEKPDDETGGEEPGGGAKPPSFPSTGPVFTPLDITAPSENYDYSYNYPSTYGPYDTGADFQSKGLLNNFGYDGGDPYQPWSQEYGDNNFTRFGGENLWNYQPPSVGDKSFYYDLSKGPGPKVGFAK